MATYILQVAYYPSVLEIRAQMLEADGYRVTSVLGNDEAMRLDGALIAAADVVVVDFSALHSVRAAMVHWLKQHYPQKPVIVLQFHGCENFPEADATTMCEDPKVWLAAVAGIVQNPFA